MAITKTGRPAPGLSQNMIKIRTKQLQAQKLQSEYQQAYKVWPWHAPRKCIKPPTKSNTNPVHVLHIDGSTMKTTNQIAFVPHKPNKRTKSHAPKREYIRDKTKMVTDTTYEVHFTPKDASRRSPCKPAENHSVSTSGEKPFNRVSAYDASYVKFTPDEQKGCTGEMKVPKDNLNVSNKHFQGTTTVQDDFKPHDNVPPAKSMRPPVKSHTSTEPFEAETTHQTDFAPKPPQQPREAFRPKEEHQKPTTNSVGRYDYLTIMMRDFPEHVGHRPEGSFKPKQGYKPSGAKFSIKTTQRMAFKAWPIPPRDRQPWAERSAYQSQKSKLRLHTVYQDDYADPCTIMPQAFENCRAASCRYENNLGAGESGPFDDRTEYKSKFIAWDGAKRAGSYKVVEEFAPPKTKFVGESIFSSHFKGEAGAPAKSCRPPQRAVSSSAKSMHFESTYRHNFRRPVSCPLAEVLSSDDVVEGEGAESCKKESQTRRPHSADK